MQVGSTEPHGSNSGDHKPKENTLKRKADESNQPNAHEVKRPHKVADHYNALPESGRAARYQSPIFFMRNFNNWIKSVLLKSFQSRLFREEQKGGLTVLDLGSGKGGDLLKWQRGNVNKLICTDIAEKSVEQCQDRYETNKRKSRGRLFNAEFIVADSTRELLKEKYASEKIKFDLVSSQFVIHYSFESEMQAETMMRNACECIRDGGYFIGTTVNSNALRRKLDRSKELSFGNDIFSVTFEDKNEFKDYGTKYDFHLEGVVDCPEYVLQKKILKKLCEKHGLKLVLWQSFDEYFETNIGDRENFNLVQRMKALEQFPSRSLNSKEPHAYDHAEKTCDKIYYDSDRRANPKVGTLSVSEWEAASIYVVFAFKKTEDEVGEELIEGGERLNDEIPLVVFHT